MHSRGLRTLRARPSVTSSRVWSTVRPVAAARRDTHGGGGGDGGAERGDPTYDDDPDGPSIVPRAPDVSDGRWCEPPPHPGAMPTDAVSRAVLQRATAPRGVNAMDTTHMRGGAALLVARAHRAQCNAIRVRGRGGAGGAGPGNAASHDTVPTHRTRYPIELVAWSRRRTCGLPAPQARSGRPCECPGSAAGWGREPRRFKPSACTALHRSAWSY